MFPKRLRLRREVHLNLQGNNRQVRKLQSPEMAVKEGGTDTVFVECATITFSPITGTVPARFWYVSVTLYTVPAAGCQ